MRTRPKYLLDTNVLSYTVKADWNKPETYLHWTSRHLRIKQERCFIPSIAVEEIVYGVHRNPIGQRRKAKIDRWFKTLQTLEYDGKAAHLAGQLRADLDSNGVSVGGQDIRIAAIALRYNATLVTHNVKDFSHIPNLRIENWANMPISMEMFFEEYIIGTMEQVKKELTLLLIFGALVTIAQKAYIVDFRQWVLSFSLNMLILSFALGVAIALSKPVLLKACLTLKKHHII